MADLDGDGRWEIVVSLAVGRDGTLARPAINVIDTPYFVQSKDGRTEEEICCWQYGHTPALDCTFPLKKEHGLMVIIR